MQPGRACAEPADRPVLARAGGFAGAGSCRHRRPWWWQREWGKKGVGLTLTLTLTLPQSPLDGATAHRVQEEE